MSPAWLILTLLTADPIPPDEAAAVQHDTEKAQAAVGKQFGDRTERELSPAERADMARARASAEKDTLEKHGLDGKTWTQHNAKLKADDRAAQDAKAKELAQKEADAAKPKPAAQDVHVQKGFNEESPVTLDEKQVAGGAVSVERDLPPDAKQEMDLARQMSGMPNDPASGAGGPPPKAEAPAPRKGGRRGR